MSANDLQQSLLNSMQILSETAVNQDNAVKSIKATIVNIKDEGLNIYTVSYGGNQFEASATSSSVKYQTGDIVYVLIPDGDFSQKKLIIGAVAARATMYSFTTQTSPYFSVSTNLFGSIDEIKMKSWVDENTEISVSDFGLTLSEYLEEYKTICFSAKVKTDIDKDHQIKGNYGLILELPFKVIAEGGQIQEVSKFLIMDVDTMEGNPYAFLTDQQIKLYFDIEDRYEYDLNRTPKLIKFVKDFGYIEPRSTDPDFYDIFFKDISIQVMDSIPESAENGYSLSIVSNSGNFFLSGDSTTKVLKPILRLDGKETTVDSWSCYWFEEDASIKVDSDGYLPLGGQGWKCVNKKTNVSYDGTGKKNFQYVINQYSLAVLPQDVVGSLRYKCILVQDDDVVSARTIIKNLNSDIEISLYSATGSNIYPENTGNIDLVARIYYHHVTDEQSSPVSIVTEWQRFDKDGRYLDNDFYSRVRINDPVIIQDRAGENKRVLESEITYPCSSLDQLNLITCTFYSVTIENGDTIKKNLGTAQISVTTSNVLSYRALIINGDVIYKYDADGDSPLIADYDGPVSSQIKNILPIEFRLFKEDGTELTDEDYKFCKFEYKIPKNSMITASNAIKVEEENDYYIYSGYGQKSLSYNIANVYSKVKNNNTILLTLEYAGNVIKESINIRFLKDGESGTNGTKYAAVIKYNNFAYGERDQEGRLRKLQAVSIGGSTWKIYDVENNSLVIFGSPQLSVDVYKDGEKINSGYTVSWSMFDPLGDSFNANKTSFNINSSTGILSIKEQWSNADNIYTNIVVATITINSGSDSSHYETLLVYYPIEITRLMNSSYEGKLIPTIDGGFSEVLYATDGTNPSYDNSSSFVFTNNVFEDASNHYNYVWDNTCVNLELKEHDNGTAVYRPISKYVSGNSKNYVKASITMNLNQQTELQNLVNAANTELTNLNSNKNYYNSILNSINNLSDFNRDDYISYLDTSQLLLLNITKGVEILNNLDSLKEEIITYCQRPEVIAVLTIDLISIIESHYERIELEKESLHSLIKGGSLDNLTPLTNCIIIITESMINDISIYIQIKTMIDRWNQLINIKYNSIYSALTRKTNNTYDFQNQVNNLKSNVYDSIFAFVNNKVTPFAENEGDKQQEFQNLKNNILNIANRLNNKDVINSYSEIDEKVLQVIDNLLIVYKDINYQENLYNELINNINENIRKKEKEREGYSEAILPSTTTAIVHIKPIIMTYNRYEMSNINGWDGNKLYTDSSNNSYLLAPQVGAGRKNNDNSFTGIVLGNRKIYNSGSFNTEVGLFGYHEGEQTIFLNAENGESIFGKGSNTIRITPEKASIIFDDYQNGKIYSGNHYNFNSPSNGFYLSSDGLSIGSNFFVDANGYLETLNGTFRGSIYSDDGQIGGWNLLPGMIYADSPSVGLRLISDGTIIIGDKNSADVFISKNLVVVPNLAMNGTFTYYYDNTSTTLIGSYSYINMPTPYYDPSTGTTSWPYDNTRRLYCFLDRYYSDSIMCASNIYAKSAFSSSGPSKVLTTCDVPKMGFVKTSELSGASVRYASTAGSADYATNAGSASYATNAGSANYATNAGSAATAAYANTAGSVSWNNVSGKPTIPTNYLTGVSDGGRESGTGKYMVHSVYKSDSNVEYTTMEVTGASDRRLKVDIEKLDDFTDLYMGLSVYKFKYNPKLKATRMRDYVHYGIMAQDTMALYEKCGISKENIALFYKESCDEVQAELTGDKTYWSMNRDELHALHIQMIQKQQKEIEKLTNELIHFKDELNVLKQQMEVKGC